MPIPVEARSGAELSQLLVQPNLRAGDLLVLCAGTAYGLTGGSGSPATLVTGVYIGSRARPQAGLLRSDWPVEEEWMAGLTPPQRAVLGVPLQRDATQCTEEEVPLPPVMSDGRARVWLGTGRAEDHHPSGHHLGGGGGGGTMTDLAAARAAGCAVDPVELYTWGTSLSIVLLYIVIANTGANTSWQICRAGWSSAARWRSRGGWRRWRPSRRSECKAPSPGLAAATRAA